VKRFGQMCGVDLGFAGATLKAASVNQSSSFASIVAGILTPAKYKQHHTSQHLQFPLTRASYTEHCLGSFLGSCSGIDDAEDLVAITRHQVAEHGHSSWPLEAGIDLA
jgi:hypothetical protein